MGTITALVTYVVSLVLPNGGGSPAFQLVWADIVKIAKAALTTAAAAGVVYALGQLALLDKTNPATLLIVTVLTGLLTTAQRFLTNTSK